MEDPETSSSSWGRWQPEPSGWPPFASAEPAPAAASKKKTQTQTPPRVNSPCINKITLCPRRFTSFAFCFRRNCSGSSCRDLDCKAKNDFEVRAGYTPGSMLELMKWRDKNFKASNQKWCGCCTLAALRRISLSCSSFRCFSNWSSCSKNLS